MFMTASTWGTWRQEIHKNEILNFPLGLYDADTLYQIEDNVDLILNRTSVICKENKNEIYSDEQMLPLIYEDKKIVNLQNELDERVFDLYQLTQNQRNLIKERCKWDIDLYYKGANSEGMKPIKIPEQNKNTELEKSPLLSEYLDTLKSKWKGFLRKYEFLTPTIYLSDNHSIICVIFELTHKKEEPTVFADLNLDEFDKLLQTKISDKIFSEGVLRRVTDAKITVVKKNRKMNWTKSEAVKDADATLLKILNPSN